jgi:hypothetical protein
MSEYGVRVDIGDLVRIGDHGVSLFTVVDVEDPDHVLIESTLDIPKYPFRMRTDWLRAADS